MIDIYIDQHCSGKLPASHAGTWLRTEHWVIIGDKDATPAHFPTGMNRQADSQQKSLFFHVLLSKVVVHYTKLNHTLLQHDPWDIKPTLALQSGEAALEMSAIFVWGTISYVFMRE